MSTNRREICRLWGCRRLLALPQTTHRTSSRAWPLPRCIRSERRSNARGRLRPFLALQLDNGLLRSAAESGSRRTVRQTGRSAARGRPAVGWRIRYMLAATVTVQILRRDRPIRRARRVITRDILTAERARRAPSTILKEQQAANYEADEDCGIQHNSHEPTQMPLPHRVLIHLGPFDAPVQQPFEKATATVNWPSTDRREICRFWVDRWLEPRRTTHRAAPAVSVQLPTTSWSSVTAGGGGEPFHLQPGGTSTRRSSASPV